MLDARIETCSDSPRDSGLSNDLTSGVTRRPISGLVRCHTHTRSPNGARVMSDILFAAACETVHRATAGIAKGKEREAAYGRPRCKSDPPGWRGQGRTSAGNGSRLYPATVTRMTVPSVGQPQSTNAKRRPPAKIWRFAYGNAVLRNRLPGQVTGWMPCYPQGTNP